MRISRIVFFILRLFLYFSVISLIIIHPGITVSFDRIGILQWFVIIPIYAIAAFIPAHNLRRKIIIAALSLFILSVWAGGFSTNALPPFFAGFISFTLTFLLFRYPRWAKAAALEPFFLAWVCLRLLALSRSGEDIAGQSMALTQFILVWTAVVFLFHSVIVYLCLFPQSSKRAWREGAVFFLSSLGLLVLVFIVLPPDFISNAVIENLLSQRMPERIREGSDRGIPREGRRQGRRTLPRDGDGQRPELRGLSEHEWQNRGRGRGSGESSEDNLQYMIKIVASETEPVYMGNVFRGQLDPAEGFLVSQDEPINNLVNQRLFVTWFNYEPNFDIGRIRQEIFSLSTLPQKYLPWQPVVVDPVILNEDSGPLRYIHQVVSNIHFSDALLLVNYPSRRFDFFEEYMLAPYLDLPLEKNDMAVFNGWLNNALDKWQKNREDLIRSDRYLWEIFSARGNNFASGINLEPVNEYLEIILAILTCFSEYQYNLNYDNDYSIASLKEFLFNSSEGDCVEFSNSLALFGRLAGIPSRVVTGYLAAEGLQTTAHLRGLATLREQISVLRQFPFNNLYMVTNLHGHSWTQFYIPDYGWLDFEATSFAIPPVGMGDFNNWDVVIPLIDDERVFSQIRKFPWRAVLRTAGILAILILVCAYVLRYGRELALYLGTQRGGRAGARSLYLLLLARLAADGKPIKPASKTAFEYAELFPSKTGGETPDVHFVTFASLYSELRWREFGDKTLMDERFLFLKQEYRSIIKITRRKGLFKFIIRIFSLRGLAYL